MEGCAGPLTQGHQFGPYDGDIADPVDSCLHSEVLHPGDNQIPVLSCFRRSTPSMRRGDGCVIHMSSGERAEREGGECLNTRC